MLVFNTLISEQSFLPIIKRRNIQWLCHFTPRQNLESIRKFGLKPRNLLPQHAVVTDTSRYDQHNNAICLSINKPNRWMFDAKIKQGLDLCLLLVDPVVLYRKQCLFYPHNAATNSYRNAESALFAGSQALANLFSDEITFQKSGKEPQTIYRSQNPRLTQSETTSDQAEVQCLEAIESRYILHIIEENIPLTYYEIVRYMERYEDSNNSVLKFPIYESNKQISASESNTNENVDEAKIVASFFKEDIKAIRKNDKLLDTSFQTAEIVNQSQSLSKSDSVGVKEKDNVSLSRNKFSSDNEYCIYLLIIFIIWLFIL